MIVKSHERHPSAPPVLAERKPLVSLPGFSVNELSFYPVRLELFFTPTTPELYSRASHDSFEAGGDFSLQGEGGGSMEDLVIGVIEEIERGGGDVGRGASSEERERERDSGGGS